MHCLIPALTRSYSIFFIQKNFSDRNMLKLSRAIDQSVSDPFLPNKANKANKVPSRPLQLKGIGISANLVYVEQNSVVSYLTWFQTPNFPYLSKKLDLTADVIRQRFN